MEIITKKYRLACDDAVCRDAIATLSIGEFKSVTFKVIKDGKEGLPYRVHVYASLTFWQSLMRVFTGRYREMKFSHHDGSQTKGYYSVKSVLKSEKDIKQTFKTISGLIPHSAINGFRLDVFTKIVETFNKLGQGALNEFFEGLALNDKALFFCAYELSKSDIYLSLGDQIKVYSEIFSLENIIATVTAEEIEHKIRKILCTSHLSIEKFASLVTLIKFKAAKENLAAYGTIDLSADLMINTFEKSISKYSRWRIKFFEWQLAHLHGKLSEPEQMGFHGTYLSLFRDSIKI